MAAPPDVLVVAGEPSGDLAAAGVVRHVNNRRPCHFFGIGGDALEAQGVELVAHIRDLAAVGFWASAARFGRWSGAWARLREMMRTRKPRAALLVDAPEVNLPLARVAGAGGARVVYYIGPQVWAWRRERLDLIRERTDIVALVLPFEKPMYDDGNISAEFVGHPVLDVHPLLAPETVRTQLCLGPRRKVVALLPGSRPHELARHAPAMIAAGRALVGRNIEVVVPLAPSLRSSRVAEAVVAAGLRPTPPTVTVRDLFQITDAALIASGTATLEAAVARVPMAVVYRIDRLSYLAGRYLFDIPFVALPNWIAGERVVPELLQDEVTADRLVEQCLELLEPSERVRQMAILDAVARSLGTPGAAARTAALVLERIG